MFILGKGYGEPIALEGALKIKEMCYLHAEGFSGGALKHGPFALIEGESGKYVMSATRCPRPFLWFTIFCRAGCFRVY